ncbi:MAG: hypothetical protein P1U58_19830 [Verrucomicrobiales bacterium]|nr:hypothetical protein [Verrucomicrobiales bacterium]
MAYHPYIVTRNIDGFPEQVAVLYYHSNGAEENALEDAIESLTNRRLSPSRLLFICGNGRQGQIKEQFEALDSTVLERVQVAHQVQILPYDHTGAAMTESAISLQGSGWEISDDELGEIARDGLETLIDQTGVILNAPRGYVFRKPSGRAKRVFIRTGNIFREPSSLALTSHLLLRTMPLGIKSLYIDSFTILPAAMAFQKERAEVARASGVEDSEPAIINFHSYDIDPDLRFPGDDEYAVLISASTSGGLARKLVEGHGANPLYLYHLLVFGEDEDLNERTIYFRQSESEVVPANQAFQREIHIPGEEFVAAHSSPKPIKITKGHIDSGEGKILKDPFYQESLQINLTSQNNSSYSLFGLSDDGGDQCDAFKKWLKEELEHSIPANVGWILSVDDDRSRRLAERAKSILSDHIQREIPLVSVSEVKSEGKAPVDDPNHTVLIVASDTGLGEDLLTASRLLRQFKHNHRHYVVGHLLQETATRLERMMSNLRVSGRPRQYGWSIFFGSPSGQFELHDTWKAEHSMIEQNLQSEEAENLDQKLRNVLAERHEILGGQTLQKDSVFLPRPDLNPLLLRPESVLHPGSYREIAQTTVYLGVSIALQRARDRMDPKGNEFEDDLCFSGNPFMPSVLDPDTFSRFNDGVIQSAILRACAPDELNYSNDRVLSRQMSNILIAAINHHETDSGEAVYEMLFALSTKRLRIQDEHFFEVIDAIEQQPTIDAFWNFLKAEAPI